MKVFNKAIIFLFILLIIFNSNAQKQQLTYPKIISPYDKRDYTQDIKHIYRTVLNKNQDTSTRIIKASNYFLGQRYLFSPAGEGPQGKFDQQPLYRTDAFDCTTFVETTLALAKAKNPAEFEPILKKIRYKNGQVSFFQRNHFTGVDWNKNNQRQDFIKDITDQFSIPYKTTNTLIDKPNWYRTVATSRIKLLYPTNQQQAQHLISEFRANANKVKPEISNLKYLPLSELFFYRNGQLQANTKVFDSIPSPAIIEIVHKNYNLTKIIGTHLDVSHMGFAIRTKQGLMFRQASEISGKTTDTPLIQYLLNYYKVVRDPDYVGINIQKIL